MVFRTLSNSSMYVGHFKDEAPCIYIMKAGFAASQNRTSSSLFFCSMKLLLPDDICYSLDGYTYINKGDQIGIFKER